MENLKINEINKKNKFYLIYALVLNVLFLLCFCLLFNIQYETNDDVGMQSIIYGYCGFYDEHLVFINIIVGKLLKCLLLCFPNIPWYAVLEVICVFASFYTVTCILIKKDMKIGTLISVIMLLFFGYNCYVFLQFTKVAGVLTISGLILLLDSIKNDYFNIGVYILSLILSLFGSFYRFDCFLMMFVPAMFFGLFCVLERCEVIKIVKMIILSAFILTVSFVGMKYNNYLYEQSEEWGYYKEFNTYRGNLLDLGFPDYEKNEAEYSNIGLSVDDISFFGSWNFYDRNTFGLGVAEYLVGLKEDVQKKIDFEFIYNFSHQLFLNILSYSWMFALFFCYVLLLYKNRKKTFLIFILTIGTVVISQFYLFYIGRFLQERVDVVFFFGFFVSCSVIYFCIQQYPLTASNYNVLYIISTLFIITAIVIYSRNNNYQIDNYEDADVFNAIQADKDHLYIAPTLGAIKNVEQSVWNIEEKGCRSNYIETGGWGTYMPVKDEILQNYGLDNMFSDCIDNDSVYVISGGQIDSIIKYINRHYNEQAQAYLAKKIDCVEIYKICTEIKVDNAKTLQEDVVYQFDTEVKDGKKYISGYAYSKGSISYRDNVVIRILCENEELTDYMVQEINPQMDKESPNLYSSYMYEIDDNLDNIVQIEVYYCYNDELFQLCRIT